MKKVISIMLAAVMILALSACGEIIRPYSEIKPVDIDNDKTEEITTIEPEPETEISMGTVQGNVYTNEFMGFRCTLDDEWTYLSREEIDAMVSDMANYEELSDMNLEEILEKSGAFSDMQASMPDETASTSVAYEKINMLQQALVTTKDIAEKSVDHITEIYEALGATLVSKSATTVSFLGEQHDAAVIHMDVNGVSIYTTQVMLKKDSYLCAVTASSFYEDHTAEILSCYTAI